MRVAVDVSAARGRRGERGAAAVEAALVICFIVLPLVFGIIAYAYMLSFRQSLSQAATEGARAAAVLYTSDTGAARAAGQQQAAQRAVNNALSSFGVTCDATLGTLRRNGEAVGSCQVSVLTAGSAGCDSAAHNCMQVNLNYLYRDHTLLPTVPGLGFTLPGDLGYSATAEVS